MFGLVGLFSRYGLVGLVLYAWYCRFGLEGLFSRYGLVGLVR